MSKTALRISKDLALPIDVVTSTLVVYGGKGMGKTNFLSVVAEESTAAGLRWCALDPMGVLWGLRHSADGKGPGLECLILGGPHGDIPIEPTAGAIVAELVVNEDANVVIDFSRHANGKMWSKGERVRFLTAFAVRLFELQGELVDGRRRAPLLILLDEAARYVPQSLPKGGLDLAECLGAWEQIAEEGRNIGLGAAFFTQRSARLAKSIAELADAMIAFRTVGPLSLSAVLDWLGDHVPKERHRELVEQVRKLPIGTALVVSPGWLQFEGIAAMRARTTFDSSATPKAGERRRVTGKGARPVDLGKYRDRMAETIERAKATDPKELQKALREARAEIRKLQERPEKTAPTPEPERIEVQVEVPVLDEDGVLALKRAAELFDEHVRVLEKMAGDAEGIVAVADAVLEAARKGLTDRARQPSPTLPISRPQTRGQNRKPETDLSAKRQASRPVPAPSGDVPEVKAGARRMLEVLARQHPMTLTRAGLGMAAKVKRTGGTFSTYFGVLRTTGLIEETDGRVGITQAGFDFLGEDPPPPLSGAELREMYRARFKAGARRMFDELVGAYPGGLSREELGERAGITMTGGTFSTYLGHMRANDVVEESGGLLFATDWLFEERG